MERDIKIDVLRGFAIILVVLGHCIQYSVPNFDDNLVFRLIYSFHMPLFMFISGYVAAFGKNFSIDTVIKKAKLLLWPFLTYSMIFVSILLFTNSKFDISIIKKYYVGLLYSPDNGGLWFLWVLFFEYLILIILKKINRVFVGGILFLIILYLTSFVFHVNIFGVGLLKWHLPFFLSGYFLNEHKIMNRMSSITKNVVLIIAILIFMVINSFWKRTGIELNFYLAAELKIVLNLALNYLVAFSGITILWIIKEYISFENKVGFFVENIGKNTLEIYYLQFYAISVAIQILKFFSCSIWYLLVFILAFGLIAIMLFLSKKTIFGKILFLK